jgi:eukaryotic-like serine/threonine-protein kinase
MAISTGTTLGHYRIRSLLGTGGLGEVYLAEDTRSGHVVALKVLPKHSGTDEDQMRRFAREARAASSLRHPNIVGILEVGSVGQTKFIATELIAGKTLRQHMASSRMMLDEWLDVAIQVARALAAAHGKGIIHRDIKPENIMLQPGGEVKVLDFGLAKVLQRGLLSGDVEVSTDPGTPLGTVSYMSPEQARVDHLDARSDVFSLGVVLYEMIAGRRPFEAGAPVNVLHSIMYDEPPPLSQYAPAVPAELDRIVRRALAKNREDRLSTEELLTSLERLKFDGGLDSIANPEERKVFDALADPRWDFRTIEGIQKATGMSESRTLEIIRKYEGDRIRKSGIPDANGRDLYTLRRNRSAAEFWDILRTFISKSIR